MAKYRILSLDGGGIRGLLTSILLERLEDQVPGWIDKIDLVAGTSTGGIIALGLASGLPPTRLRDLYYDNGAEIFDDSWLDGLIDLGGLRGAEYSNRNLKRELAKVLQNTLLKDLTKKVLVSAFDLDNENPDPQKRRWAPKFFHNFAGEDSDGDVKAVDVALYTSAAPTYFPAVDGYIDGGVFANNPSMAALAQTQDERAEIANRPQINDIVLLSVGTGESLFYITGKRNNWGFAQWAKPIISVMMDGVMGVADYQCKQILKDCYCRLSPTFAPGQSIKLDDWKKRDELVDIANDVDIQESVDWLKLHWM